MLDTSPSLPTISVVMPVHCEAEVLSSTLREIEAILPSLSVSYELILIDDGSTDSTWQIIAEHAKTMPHLRAVRLSRRFGKEAAICAGLELARGAAAIVMDGDLQHPPRMIPAMIEAWRNGADIVEAVKESRGDEPAIEGWRAKTFYMLLHLLSGQDLNGASDFKLLARPVLNAYLELKERNIFFRGITHWLGFERVRLPFAVPPRGAGRSHWSLVRLVRLAITAVTSFSSAPLHFITLLGGGFLLFAIVLAVQTLYRKFSGSSLDGFTTVILLLLIIGSLLMVGLGIIGEYIARIYEEVKSRPRYVVKERLDDNERQQ